MNDSNEITNGLIDVEGAIDELKKELYSIKELLRESNQINAISCMYKLHNTDKNAKRFLNKFINEIESNEEKNNV